MNLLSIILIALGLSMDSFAVSLSNGLTVRNLNLKKTLFISLSLSFFQAIMPLIGWFAGMEIENYIREFDHWIAFLLLSLIGSKMIYAGYKKDDSSINLELKISTVIGQSIATSIDAFTIGISFALLNLSILIPVLIIGTTTFVISIIGLNIGKFYGKKIGKSVEVFGGFVLIGIGLKIIIEHIFFH